MSEQKSIFLLEENITRAYHLAQQQIATFIKSESKFTLKEIAEKMKLDRGTLSKKLKESSFESKQFYDLLNLVNKEFQTILQEKRDNIENDLETKTKENE